MNGLKKIMYGVTDFPRMRKENAYFVDRTALIPELEKTRYSLFLRPRRFGGQSSFLDRAHQRQRDEICESVKEVCS